LFPFIAEGNVIIPVRKKTRKIFEKGFIYVSFIWIISWGTLFKRLELEILETYSTVWSPIGKLNCISSFTQFDGFRFGALPCSLRVGKYGVNDGSSVEPSDDWVFL
jgi:hypothetical protein